MSSTLNCNMEVSMTKATVKIKAHIKEILTVVPKDGFLEDDIAVFHYIHSCRISNRLL